MRAYFLAIIPLFIFGLSSCASYKLHYHQAHEDWEASQPAGDQAPVHRVYLIGDAGNAKTESTPPVLQYLRQELASAPVA